jgi:hypothetical protein
LWTLAVYRVAASSNFAQGAIFSITWQNDTDRLMKRKSVFGYLGQAASKV